MWVQFQFSIFKEIGQIYVATDTDLMIAVQESIIGKCIDIFIKIYLFCIDI